MKDFARIAKPLHRLVRKNEKWKQVFTIQPVLVVPDLDKKMRVKADTLEYATGGVLSMRYEDNK